MITLKHAYDSVLNVLADRPTVSTTITVLDHINHYVVNALEICARNESVNRLEFLALDEDCETLDIKDGHELDLTEHRVFYKKDNSWLAGRYDTVWGVGNPMGGLLDKNGFLCDRQHVPTFMNNLSSLLVPNGVLVLEILDTLDWSPWYEIDSSDGTTERTDVYKHSEFPEGLLEDLETLGITKPISYIEQQAKGKQYASYYEVSSVYTIVFQDTTTETVCSAVPIMIRRYGIREILEFAQSAFSHVALVQAIGRQAITCFKDGVWINSAAPTHLVCSNTPLKGECSSSNAKT